MAERSWPFSRWKWRRRSLSAPEAVQARRLLQESSAEFGKENYGGALYLANQAKALAAAGADG